MANDTNKPIDPVPSPCIRNCCLDEHDICIGCFRSLYEITHWSSASESEKQEIIDKCDLRSKQYHDKYDVF